MNRAVFKTIIFCLWLACAWPAAAQNPDLNVNGSSPYLSLGKGIAWANVNRAYFFTPLSPQSTICVYLVNNNPTNAHPLTLQIFQTGDPQVPRYSGFTGRWTAAGVQGSISPVAASSTGSAFAITNAAASIAIVISGAGALAGSPDTVDAYVVQTTANNCGSVGNGGNIIAGPVPAGGSYGNPPSFAPLFLGCYGQGASPGSGYSSPAGVGTVVPVLCDNSFSSGGGLLIGHESAAGAGANFGGWVVLEGFNNGNAPFGVAPCAMTNTAVCHALGLNNNFLSNGSLFVSTGGSYGSVTTSNITANSQNQFSNATAQLAGGMSNACTVEYTLAGSITGTSPTLNVYFQTSPDNGTTWDDRVSFTQISTSGPTHQSATIVTGSAGIVPYTPTNQTLAAGSIINGPIQADWRVAFVVGGTTPNFAGPLILYVNCT